jgi:hypothetical protein
MRIDNISHLFLIRKNIYKVGGKEKSVSRKNPKIIA